MSCIRLLTPLAGLCLLLALLTDAKVNKNSEHFNDRHMSSQANQKYNYHLDALLTALAGDDWACMTWCGKYDHRFSLREDIRYLNDFTKKHERGHYSKEDKNELCENLKLWRLGSVCATRLRARCNRAIGEVKQYCDTNWESVV